jgi:ankyrin repeat protein
LAEAEGGFTPLHFCVHDADRSAATRVLLEARANPLKPKHDGLTPLDVARKNGCEESGALLASGLFVVAGAFRGDLAFAAVLLAAMTYLAFGLSRAFSIVVDGAPDDMLVIVAALEIAWGLVCASAVSGRLRQPAVEAGEGLPISA